MLMFILQMCFEPLTINGPFKMCRFNWTTQWAHRLPGSMKWGCWLQECPPEPPPINWTIISLQLADARVISEAGSASNQPHNWITPLPHPASFMQSAKHQPPKKKTLPFFLCLHQQSVSAQTVKIVHHHRLSRSEFSAFYACFRAYW